MSLIWGVTRIVPFVQKESAINKEQMLVFEFMMAYNDLRKSCSKGDLRIHLSVEGSREDVGVIEETRTHVTSNPEGVSVMIEDGKVINAGD